MPAGSKSALERRSGHLPNFHQGCSEQPQSVVKSALVLRFPELIAACSRCSPIEMLITARPR